MTNLIIPIGIPGCGKSTWAKTFLDLKYTVVSSDEIRKDLFGSLVAAHAGDGTEEADPLAKAQNNERVFGVFHRRIEDSLNHGVDVFADATNLNPFARKRLVDIAAECGAKAHAILFKNPDEALMRNRRRDEDQIVPHEVMMMMYAKYIDTLRDIFQEDYDTVTEICSVR